MACATLSSLEARALPALPLVPPPVPVLAEALVGGWPRGAPAGDRSPGPLSRPTLRRASFAATRTAALRDGAAATARSSARGSGRQRLRAGNAVRRASGTWVTWIRQPNAAGRPLAKTMRDES